MAGRRPVPTKLKILRGNPGKRRIIPDAIEPPPMMTAPPEELTADARREWDRVIAILGPSRIVTEADRAALACYCQAWGTWIEAERQLRKQKYVVRGATGAAVANPLIKISRDAAMQVHKLATEFGLTPSSRCKIKRPEQEPPSHEAPIAAILD